MKAADEVKFVNMVQTVALGTDAVSGYVDTKGFSDLTVLLNGVTAAAGDVMTTLKLQHGDTTSAFTDISGAVGGTDATGGFIIPAPNTSTGDIIGFRVGLKGKKRYVNISMVGDATTRNTTVLGVLSRPEIVGTAAADLGLTTLVKV